MPTLPRNTHSKVQSPKPRHGWAPDPPMVGIRSPIGLVVESCTSHPGVLGSIPKREEPGKTGAPCVKVPGSSSPDLGGLQIPRWLRSDPLSAWWLGLAPVTLEFWVRFPNERNQGKHAHPVSKYRVPHGSHLHGLSRRPHEHVHSSKGRRGGKGHDGHTGMIYSRGGMRHQCRSLVPVDTERG
jgi:hypothetical protein